jgi:hypothetical protein
MNSKILGRLTALAALCVAAGILMAPRMCASPSAKQQQAPPETASVVFALPTRPPKGAVVLFSGKANELQANWVERNTNNPPDWTVGEDGVATPKKADITSKQEFGDCFVHVEFRCPADANGNPVTSGNSGVGMEGRYEIQILNSYGQAPEAHQCGAIYSQKAPLVIASKKPGEWQTYDIIFRAPRLDENGQVKEKARFTVFQNGILIQNNEETLGPTGIQYGDFKGEAKTGPIVLQGNHDPVQFRSVWVVPTP